MTSERARWAFLIVSLLLILWPSDGIPSLTTEPDTLFVIYEQQDGLLPGWVAQLEAKAKAKGLNVRKLDDDITDESGQTPDYAKGAIDSAREAGLPAMVLTAKGEAVKSAKLPGSLSEAEKFLP